jgi:hypothetical protein
MRFSLARGCCVIDVFRRDNGTALSPAHYSASAPGILGRRWIVVFSLFPRKQPKNALCKITLIQNSRFITQD